MPGRRFLLRITALAFCLALAAVGGWAVRPYLPGPHQPAPRAADAAPETTEELIARLEELRSQKRDLGQKESEFARQVWSERAELERQERVILSELKKREADNQRRLTNLGHGEASNLVSAR